MKDTNKRKYKKWIDMVMGFVCGEDEFGQAMDFIGDNVGNMERDDCLNFLLHAALREDCPNYMMNKIALILCGDKTGTFVNALCDIKEKIPEEIRKTILEQGHWKALVHCTNLSDDDIERIVNDGMFPDGLETDGKSSLYYLFNLLRNVWTIPESCWRKIDCFIGSFRKDDGFDEYTKRLVVDYADSMRIPFDDNLINRYVKTDLRDLYSREKWMKVARNESITDYGIIKLLMSIGSEDDCYILKIQDILDENRERREKYRARHSSVV